MTEPAKSVFGSVDQEAILANFSVATDDGEESSFFAVAVDDTSEGPGLAEATLQERRSFILYGPAGLEIA